MGKLKNFRGKLTLKDNAVPQLRKACEVPFALRPKVEEELERLTQEETFHLRNLVIGRHPLCLYLKEMVKCESVGLQRYTK